MGLTGTGIRIGTATEFDQGVRFPRGLASDGTNVVMFDANRAFNLDVETGIATQIGAAGLGVGANQIRAATYHDGNFLFWDNSTNSFYSFNRDTGLATLESGFGSSADFWAIASFNNLLYAIDRADDYLVTIDLVNETEAQVGNAEEFGVSSGNVQALCAYDGGLIGISVAIDKILSIDETDGTADIIANANILPDGAPEAAVEHDGFLYFLGSAADALFRLYDVLWDETIDAIEVDEGGNGRLDLSTVSEDAASFEFAPGYTAPGWLTISGMDLVITNAPDVSSDTDFEPQVRAIRDSKHEDKTLTVRVIAEAAPLPPLNPPTFTAPAANYEVNERANGTIDSTGFFTGHTSLAFRSGYSAPSWLTISGLNVVITGAPDVLEATDFTVPLTATNNDGSVNGSITISVQQIDPAPVFDTPNRFDIDEGSSSVFDLSGDLQNTESLAYQSGYSAPSWLTISGLTLVITNAQQVSQDTDFDVLLAAESTKTAATADRTVTIRVRDVAVPPPPVTPPGAPTSLSLTETHNSIVARWAAAVNNGARLRVGMIFKSMVGAGSMRA